MDEKQQTIILSGTAPTLGLARTTATIASYEYMRMITVVLFFSISSLFRGLDTILSLPIIASPPPARFLPSLRPA
jgi:hypothetical protein